MQSLLVAHDLTEASHFVTGRAVRIAAKTGASLRFVHVPSQRASNEDYLAARKTLQKEVRHLMEELTDRELDASFTVPYEKPEAAILAEAERIDADLILIGAHGEPRMRDVLFGTTAMHLIRHSARPLLVVQNDDRIPYSKLLLAVDNVSAAEDALRSALELAPQGEIFAVHAFERKLGQVGSEGEVLEQVRSDQQLALERLLQKIGTGGEKPVASHAIVQDGDVMRVIMDAWTKIDPDLIIMATHGRSGFSHMLHGSFTDYVLLGCTSDILVMRRHGSKS